MQKTKDITGLKKGEIKKLITIRNKLAHEFTPKIIPAASIPFSPGADFQILIRNYKLQDVYCLTNQNTIGIDSNALNHKLYYLLKYAIEKFDGLSDGKIEKIRKYLNKTQ